MKSALLVLVCGLLCVIMCGCSEHENAPDMRSYITPASTDASSGNSDDMRALHMPTALSIPEIYQATWTSNTGKTRVYVDALMEVYPADAYPVIGVELREATQADVQALSDIVFAGAGYSGEIEFSVSENEAGQGALMSLELYDKRLINGIPLSAVGASMQFYRGALNSSYIWYNRRQGSHEYYYSHIMPSDLSPGEAIPDSAYDYESAYALAATVRDALSPSLTCVSVLRVGGEVYGAGGLNTDAPVIRAPVDAYNFHFTRAVNGVPVTFEAGSGSSVGVLGREQATQVYSPPYVYEELSVVISDVGIYSVQFGNPYALKDTIIESAALLPFDDVMNIAREVLPLKYSSYERGFDGFSAYIDRIALGYMSVMRRDMPDKYALTPVWDLFGHTERVSAEYGDGGYDFPYTSLLTINAIDGTIIDRGYGY